MTSMKQRGDAFSKWSSLSPDQRQAAIARISSQCRLPDGALTLDSGTKVRLQPPADASYEAVDCALKQLMPALGIENFSFVGNEAYAKDE
ncbi:hypothetical protein [Sphingomonas arenae]|uniref:hypothetical protein n=1 Tax=Sphingomonas arenae TaxID=2812555 RepID=UPI0019685B89|nr:hypothetical protein [Sphingomonas arenae]